MAMDVPRLTEELPNEIAMGILSKLPVKSLVRFRCVSKSLSAAVRSPSFIASYHSLQKQNRDPQILLKLCGTEFRDDKPCFTILSTEFRPTETIKMPFLDDCIYHPVVNGPCNGLLCLSDDDRIAIWNPSTREFKHIPPSTIHRLPEMDLLLLGPVGFGFDFRTGEYKVIRFITNYFNDGMSVIRQVEIYCLNSNSWREICAPDVLVHGFSTFGDFENGLYHWAATENDFIILSFDLTNESFTTTALPEFEGDYLWDFVKSSGGAMTLIAYPRDGEEKVFDLWVNKDGWVKELSIGPFPGVERPLGLWKDGQLFFEGNNGELLLLHLQSGEMKNFGLLSDYPRKMQVIVYAESLVPINGVTEQQERIIREMVHH